MINPIELKLTRVVSVQTWPRAGFSFGIQQFLLDNVLTEPHGFVWCCSITVQKVSIICIMGNELMSNPVEIANVDVLSGLPWESSSMVRFTFSFARGFGNILFNSSIKWPDLAPLPPFPPFLFFPTTNPPFIDLNWSVISRSVLLIWRSGRFWKVFLHRGHW